MQSKTERLKEYGMYIRRTAEGTYNLGWTFSQRSGGIANFPSYSDAYDTFEELIGTYWDYHVEQFQQFMESGTYQGGSKTQSRSELVRKLNEAIRKAQNA